MVEKLKSYFTFGTISHKPGSLLFYGSLINQDTDDGSITLTADEKVSEVVPNEVSRDRRKNLEPPITSVELTNYRSVNGMLSWLGMLISPLSAFNSSFFATAVTFSNS